MMDRLKDKVSGFPEKPGIYIFKNKAGQVLYIGKARSLRERLRSYFLPNPDFKVRNILRETTDIDYLLTGSEKEAAFLENNFIQQHQPKFNLRLKDDKSLPYLRLSIQERFPAITLSRKVQEDAAAYFGPFSPAGGARKTIHLINKHFGIRGCEERVFKNRKRPCLEHDLGLCSAPCAGLRTEAKYREDVHSARLFLEGKTEELTKGLRQKMKAAAGAQKFEEAARLRDFLRILDDIKQRPRTISVGLEDLDVVGFARSGEAAVLHVFIMRRGKIRDSREVFGTALKGTPDSKVLADLLQEFYAGAEKPASVLLPFETSRMTDLQIGNQAGLRAKTRLIVPRSGRQARLIELANKNAERAIQKRGQKSAPLLRLAEALGLDRVPQRIEGFDISNTGGDESVGSLVVFDGEMPNKREYRKYKIRTVRGPNDVASLREVISRRYARLIKEGSTLPDLVLVDGGKGQLQAALLSLSETGMDRIPVISLAKKEEIIFTTGNREGLRLHRTSSALKLIQHIRDEAHRFAVSFHRKRREKKSFASELDEIPGLGPKRKALLQARYGSLEKIGTAPPAELSSLVGEKTAHDLRERLRMLSIKRSA